MSTNIQILLVEDNKSDAALIIRALKKYNLADNLIHLVNGAQALDFILRRENLKAEILRSSQK